MEKDVAVGEDNAGQEVREGGERRGGRKKTIWFNAFYGLSLILYCLLNAFYCLLNVFRCLLTALSLKCISNTMYCLLNAFNCSILLF